MRILEFDAINIRVTGGGGEEQGLSIIKPSLQPQDFAILDINRAV